MIRSAAMDALISSSTFPFFFVTVILISRFAPVSSSSHSFASDGLRNNAIDDDSSLSFATLIGLPTEAVYNFGDSISDTGNLLRSDPLDCCGKFPYGFTFFDTPSGRFCDGLLMIDYFAKHLNLPFIDPYLKEDGNFSHGVNFAVGGATALDISTLAERYNLSPSTNLSLGVQLRWFKSHLNSLSYSASEQRSKLAKALFFMGEIGGNDFNYALFRGESLAFVYKMVPEVIEGIKSAVEEIIDLGAIRIAVPGNFPVGCMTLYLSMYETDDQTMYDELKCIKDFNIWAQFFNDQLQVTIRELQKSHPNVAIVYVDYYNALKQVLEDATILGFNKNEMYKACCGIGDTTYNVNIDVHCGSEGVPVCENPYKRVSWDGAHLTQHAYHEMAKWLVRHTSNAIPEVA